MMVFAKDIDNMKILHQSDFLQVSCLMKEWYTVL